MTSRLVVVVLWVPLFPIYWDGLMCTSAYARVLDRTGPELGKLHEAYYLVPLTLH